MSRKPEEGYVPKTKDQITQWLRVISSRDPERDVLNYPFHVVHAHTANLCLPHRLDIRIQGTLEDGCITRGVYVEYVSH